MGENKYLLVNAKILPPIYKDVLKAKKLIAEGIAPNASQAVKMVGISRSAFYKYKNYVFESNDNYRNTVSLIAVLSDKAGVFSSMSSVLYELGANIITVNQTTPVDGTARVSITVTTDNIKVSIEELVKKLSEVKGILTIKTE